MRVTYELTEAFYKGASMKVKKTDYLRAKTTLLNMESMLLSFNNATQLAKSALCFEMGKGAECAVEVDENSFKAPKLQGSLEEYYQKLYLLNHQLKESDIGLQAREAAIEVAKSEYLPTMALYANAQSLHNNEHGGIINSQNNDSWNIGAVISYNLFNGGKTDAKVQEAKAQKLKLQAQKAYLQSGLELAAKKAYLKLQAAQKQLIVMQEALKTAAQNSDLNLRAYKEEMVATKDVLEAQFIHSLTAAALYKVEYEAAINSAELDYLIGESLQ
jgi:outer membrane protein TolC